MAPEVLEQRPYDDKSDIWATGCVAYEMCSLHRPYEALNTPALYIKILTGERKELAASYSSDLRGVVDECLQGNATVRPTASDLLNVGHLRQQAIRLGSGVRPSPSKGGKMHQVVSEVTTGMPETRKQLLSLLETGHGTQQKEAFSDMDESDCFNVRIDCETTESEHVCQSSDDAVETDCRGCSPSTLWDQAHTGEGDSLMLTTTTASSSESVSRPLSCSISPEPKGRCFNWDDASKYGTMSLSTTSKFHVKRLSLTSASCKTPSDEAILRDVLCESPVTNHAQTIDRTDLELLLKEQGNKGIDENSVVKSQSQMTFEPPDQQLTGLDPVDSAMRKWQQASGCEVQLQRIGKGRYRCGDGKRLFCRLDDKGNLVVRQGSKFMPIGEFFGIVLQETEDTSCRLLAKPEDIPRINSGDALDAAILSHFHAAGEPMHFKQIGKGKYRYGNRKIFCRLASNKRVMVRKNSDFISLEDFLAANPQDENVETPHGDETDEDAVLHHEKDNIHSAAESNCTSKKAARGMISQDHDLLNDVLKTLQLKKRQLTRQLDETEARGRKICAGHGHLWRDACDVLESHLSDELVDEPQQLEVEKQLQQLLTRCACEGATQPAKAPLFLICRRIHLQSEMEKCDLKLDEVLSMIQHAGSEPVGVARPRRHSVF
jgi:hypothetical protein